MKPLSQTFGYVKRKFIFTLVPCAVGLTLVGVSTVDAMAADPTHALTCISTNTGDTVNFSYRWGSKRDWKSTKVVPGEWLLLSWRYQYAGYNRSPQLEIRYDDDFTDGAHFVRTQLKSYAVSDNRACETQGLRYEFRLRGNELYLLKMDD